MELDLKPHRAAHGMVPRMFRCMYRQQSRTRVCPDTPRLDGKTVLVTGGSAGVGEFISRGALERGAKVISMSRGVSKGTGKLAEVQQIECDLSDLSSVRNAVDALNDMKIDILICNAGVALREHKMATDNIEMTYAINVLGHHLLYRQLIKQGLFEDVPRVVMTTGDAYVASKECQPNPRKFSLSRVYGGSKLGNLWQAFELSKRFPEIHATVVHPGVVLSGLGGKRSTGIGLWVMKKMVINEEQGAQAALIAATQDLPSGAYWHNVCGLMELPEGDAGLDTKKAEAMWDQLESFCADYL